MGILLILCGYIFLDIPYMCDIDSFSRDSFPYSGSLISDPNRTKQSLGFSDAE